MSIPRRTRRWAHAARLTAEKKTTHLVQTGEGANRREEEGVSHPPIALFLSEIQGRAEVLGVPFSFPDSFPFPGRGRAAPTARENC